MAILKIGFLALIISITMPLTALRLQPHTVGVVQSIPSAAPISIGLTNPLGSVIYKTDQGFPDFMLKKSLPRRPYPPTPEPYPTAFNGQISVI